MLILNTSRLTIREFKHSDLQAVHVYASDPDVAQFMTWGPNTIHETREFLKKAANYRRQKPRRDFVLAICLIRNQEAGSMRQTNQISNIKYQKYKSKLENSRLIGCVGLHVEKGKNREAFLAYCLNKKFWGFGYAHEAASSLISYGFKILNLHRITAYCHPKNHRTHRVLEKLGMIYEGYLRDKLFFKASWHDALCYSILNQEEDNSHLRAEAKIGLTEERGKKNKL